MNDNANTQNTNSKSAKLGKNLRSLGLLIVGIAVAYAVSSFIL